MLGWIRPNFREWMIRPDIGANVETEVKVNIQQVSGVEDKQHDGDENQRDQPTGYQPARNR